MKKPLGNVTFGSLYRRDHDRNSYMLVSDVEGPTYEVGVKNGFAEELKDFETEVEVIEPGVWVCTTGVYSDYTVQLIVATEEEANEWLSKMPEHRHPKIERFKIGEPADGAPWWFCTYDGEETYVEVTTNDDMSGTGGRWNGETFIAYIRAWTEEAAAKILTERYREALLQK